MKDLPVRPEPSDPAPLDELVDAIADRFEVACRDSKVLKIGDYLCDAPQCARRAFLLELVRADLEHRWRTYDRATRSGYRGGEFLPDDSGEDRSGGDLLKPWLFERYQQEHPELGIGAIW